MPAHTTGDVDGNYYFKVTVTNVSQPEETIENILLEVLPPKIVGIIDYGSEMPVIARNHLRSGQRKAKDSLLGGTDG